MGKTKRHPTGSRGTKIMAVADGASLPVALSASSASPHEVTLVEPTLDGCLLDETPERLIYDKAYDSDPLDERLLTERNIELIAPHKCNRKKPQIQDGRKLRLKADEVFYYADGFKLCWLPTLRKLWSPKGQQVMIPFPLQNRTHFGIGGVNYHTGETVVIVRSHTWRSEIAEFLRLLLKKLPGQTIYVAWDNANTHDGGEVDQVVQEAKGRLVLLYLPTYSPWLNPVEMLWRHWRREVTHCELFVSMKHLIAAVPYKIHTILTDNGVQFTNQPHQKYVFKHLFDRICQQHVIDHRLTKPNHPWHNARRRRSNLAGDLELASAGWAGQSNEVIGQ